MDMDLVGLPAEELGVEAQGEALEPVLNLHEVPGADGFLY